ncbi:MAG: NAD(P)/FAD-dependent oxidoreductase [Phycisphaerales bacterium]|nr:NAD(P)/FAD-dependent oxidoreductase [Phycisphaerales bacterium]MCI0631299.1 NAD(P)/FAD-dependent oxidoreductase [Phycisphaerales bacterium]MCI0675279.1 NAD(P)/FAD-dependent oxidoreductase [Phycisphaerales bacterium]
MSGRFDAIVIGGGPAGAMAARGLAQLGWRIALAERGPRHRSKTCGHCLHSRAIDALDRMGLRFRDEAPTAGNLRRWRAHLPDAGIIDRPLSPHDEKRVGTPGVLVDRSQFDQWLVDAAQAAGVEVFQPASARSIRQGSQGTIVELVQGQERLDVSCRVIIGADGVGSWVARRAGLAGRAERSGRKFGFSFDLKGDSHRGIDSDAINMFIVPGGYLGVVRQTGGDLHIAGLVSNGVKGPRDPVTFVRSAAVCHGALREVGLAQLQRSDLERFSAIGPFPWRPRHVANEQAALVGDAAGYAEPFTGEGMSWAIESAEALVRVAADARPGAWDAQLADAYALAWRESVGRRQRLCRFIGLALANQWVAKLLFSIGQRAPALTQRLINRAVAA